MDKSLKPQLVTYDGGRHNGDMAKSASRILKGGSWKKQRIIYLMPAGAMMASKVALSHMNLIFPPNNAVIRWLALGMEVGDAYSQAIEQILAHPDLKDWEYLLTIEHDNVPPPDGVIRLIEAMEARPDMACIGGIYWTKGEGGCPQIWGDPKDPTLNFRPQPPDMALIQAYDADNTKIPVQECCGTGMGFNLWRISMFKDERLRKPWFKTLGDKEGIGTQDLYAWGDFRKYGYRCGIDLRVRVGHYDHVQDINW